MEDIAADAFAVLDAAGFETAHIVGHSPGGPAAMQLALAARRRALSLVLLSTFAARHLAR